MTASDRFSLLRCPSSGQPLHHEGNFLVAGDGARYPIIAGIPILLPKSVAPTHQGYQAILAQNSTIAEHGTPFGDADAARFFAGMLVATCGNLFHRVELAGDYPIPTFPELPKDGPLLDIGCSWGRWSIAAARAGHRVVACDIHLQALLCAQWLARKLVPGSEPLFVLADARHLPFGAEAFSAAFSYSVIQHFSRANAELALGQIAKVLRRRAPACIQMPNRNGLSAMLRKTRARDTEGAEFDVRYYTIDELLKLFRRVIGPATWRTDCFLGLNVHLADWRFVPVSKRPLLLLDAALLAVSRAVPPIARLADSVFITATK